MKNDLWTELAAAHGFDGIRHARQVHGKKILPHDAPASGLEIGPDADGHLAGSPGVLMGVTVADCVPVFLVDPRRRSAALLHAGWRGTATGILEAGISLLSEAAGGVPEDILLHLGPAICGSCYEVGPEVHGALGLPAPEEAEPVDLRRVLEQRAMALGVLPSHITRSPFCTRCSGSPFFSHRGGDAQRQVGFLGIRPE